MPEKLSPIERALCAASQMNAHESRRVLMLICSGGMTMEPVKQPTEGEKHYARREKFIKRMKSACDDALEAAKHETLRNVRKHFRAKPPAIKGAESSDTNSLPARLTFNRKDFTDELLAALREEANAALVGAATGLFDEIGSDNPWTMPGSVTRAFLDQRANLLANVPDEIHQEIMQSIKDGLDKGETRPELMDRISAKFAEIGSGRAETIANTETAAAFNFARDKAMRAAGVTHKRWLHSQSPLIKEPRPTHVEADGQVVPIDEPFNVGGVKFMMPADDSMGAGPEDIINCHCVSIPVEAPIKTKALQHSLHEIIAQTRCGCGQPNCVKCNATKEAEARLEQFDDEKHIARI